MNDLLNNPAAQAGVLPFVVALLLAWSLARTRLLALAVASGLAVVLSLTIGFSLEPFTAVKKLILATFGAALLALLLDGTGIAMKRALVIGIALLAGGSALWQLQRVLAQMPPANAWLAGAGGFALLAVCAAGALTTSLRAAVIGALLGWGAGVLALFGASALLAQIGLALGSASAAAALVQMLRGAEAPGWTLALPAAVGAASVGLLASATGQLPWYCLLPLPLVALAGRWAPAAARRPWQAAFASGLAALVPVAVAIGIAWRAAASSTAG